MSRRRHSELPDRSPTQSLAASLAVTDDSRMPCAFFFSSNSFCSLTAANVLFTE